MQEDVFNYIFVSRKATMDKLETFICNLISIQAGTLLNYKVVQHILAAIVAIHISADSLKRSYNFANEAINDHPKCVCQYNCKTGLCYVVWHYSCSSCSCWGSIRIVANQHCQLLAIGLEESPQKMMISCQSWHFSTYHDNKQNWEKIF